MRFIPTPVGNTIHIDNKTRDKSVHPHACGEHLRSASSLSFNSGSSPRLWGTHTDFASGIRTERFIPTPVGNTSNTGPVIQVRSVHPHACGEHVSATPVITVQNGSSPRLWGTLSPVLSNSIYLRFIPTPVGNTPLLFSRNKHMAVHPHACGEHIVSALYFKSSAGSSPRLWGTPPVNQPNP